MLSVDEAIINVLQVLNRGGLKDPTSVRWLEKEIKRWQEEIDHQLARCAARERNHKTTRSETDQELTQAYKERDLAIKLKVAGAGEVPRELYKLRYRHLTAAKRQQQAILRYRQLIDMRLTLEKTVIPELTRRKEELSTMAKNKSTAIVKPEPQGIAKMEDWEIALEAKAKDEIATEQMGVPRITHRGGILKLDGQKVDGNKLPIAILGYGLMKTYYEKGYDPKSEEGQTPDCYAFASAAPGEEAKMVPHQAAPSKVCETCAACEFNRFGTAEKGNGKRCSDKRRVLCVVGVNDPDSIVKAQIRQFEIPPGSLRNWSNYLKSLKEVTASGNVRAVLTELSAEPSETGAHVLLFKPIGKLQKEQALALLQKGKDAEADLFAPFPVIKKTEKAQANAGAKSKVRGK